MVRVVRMLQDAFHGPECMERAAMWAIMLVAGYLMLFHLGYVTLWHDEGANAIMARNLAERGLLTGWDGRNLFFGFPSFTEKNPGGSFAIDSNFNLVSYPPWPAIPSALGTLLLGDSEIAIRLPHAILGFLSLPVFWLLLRMNFPGPERRRLRLVAFVLFALSPIVILYVRQGRYYPDAILFTLLTFYCYQRYFDRKESALWLVGLTLCAVLNFLNHYAIGASTAMALASWHAMLRFNRTSLREWLLLSASGVSVAAACLAWLLFAGVIGGESALEYGEEIYKYSWLHRRALLMEAYFRDLLKSGWLPWTIAAWWVVCPAVYRIYALVEQRRSSSRRQPAPKKDLADKASSPDMGGRVAWEWALLGLLLVFFSALVSIQPIGTHDVSDMRYMVMALPFILFMSASCVNWLWGKVRWAGMWLLGAMMFTSLAQFPFYITVVHERFNCSTEFFPLPKLAIEIHNPYPSAVGEAVSFLRTFARQNDTVFVQPWQDYALLLYYMSKRMIFCCGLPDNANLPREKIRQMSLPIYRGDSSPVWIVRMEERPLALEGSSYELAYSGDAYAYPTQRPELEYRCFDPPSSEKGVLRIYRIMSSETRTAPSQ